MSLALNTRSPSVNYLKVKQARHRYNSEQAFINHTIKQIIPSPTFDSQIKNLSLQYEIIESRFFRNS